MRSASLSIRHLCLAIIGFEELWGALRNFEELWGAFKSAFELHYDVLASCTSDCSIQTSECSLVVCHFNDNDMAANIVEQLSSHVMC